MAGKRVFTVPSLPIGAGVAANVAPASGAYMALQGGAATQLVNVVEIEVGGQGSTSAPAILLFGRVQAIHTGAATALAAPNADGLLHPSGSASATPAVDLIAAATTQPTSNNAATNAILTLVMNGFGGVLRWVAAPGAEYGILGNTAPLGEAMLWAFTGSTAQNVSAHIIYEPF